jgi:hypothetical protein
MESVSFEPFGNYGDDPIIPTLPLAGTHVPQSDIGNGLPKKSLPNAREAFLENRLKSTSEASAVNITAPARSSFRAFP